MAKWESYFVQGLALLLIAAAVAVVCWLSPREAPEWSADRGRVSGVAVSEGLNVLEGQTTYRFLYRDETGAIAGRWTLGRFVDGTLQEEAVWGIVDLDQWCRWAPGIFDREWPWDAKQQPGRRVSQWFRSDTSMAWNGDRFFWTVQALRFLDPQSLANQIDMLEASGRAIRILPTGGRNDYDYSTDTLYWNPTLTEYTPDDISLHRRWFQTDPRVTLAHGLSHAWHDLCRNGDAAGVEQREQIAIAAENRVRYLLFLQDPTCAHLYPRPGHRETWPDLPGDSAAEAWRNYHGVIEY